jgi:CRISPR/Cas system CSM-associated protein Csm3 (group 7 of RAMP superfamily)
MAANRTQHRFITERWVVTGTLTLETPSHFGNGDTDELTDMPLLVDEVNNQPFLPGTSIAGALRNYLRERQLGFGKKETGASLASALFGGFRGDDEGSQSPLIVFDAPGHAAGIELRDGVAIDPETRTAADEKKFDMQLLAAGSSFDLRFELAINKDREKLLSALATALHGLEDRQITLGARKRRGFGQVTAGNWRVWKYNTQDHDGLLAWLSAHDWYPNSAEQSGASLTEKLGTGLDNVDLRKTARLTASFSIDGTLLIRSGFGKSDSGPDMVHLHSPRPAKQERVPVIPGTSWAGVLRGRALKIARTVSNNLQAEDDGRKLFRKVDGKDVPILKAEVFVDNMFGPTIKPGDKNVKASRVGIKESEITEVDSLVVTRVKIDRFTGGAFESALFSEQPAVGKPETRVTLDLIVREPKLEELGVLLLLLKDLWTGDLPIGGEAGVGRGRLKGVSATLTTEGEWNFKADGEKVNVTPSADELEKWVILFNEELAKAQVNHE